jgi:transposase-like protein
VHLIRNSLAFVSWKDRKAIQHRLQVCFARPRIGVEFLAGLMAP